MFADHVGEVTVYVFDEQGRYVAGKAEANEDGLSPLKDDDYAMFFDLPVGKYQFVAYAMQRKYSDLIEEKGAKFVRSRGFYDRNLMMEDLNVELLYRPSESSA